MVNRSTLLCFGLIAIRTRRATANRLGELFAHRYFSRLFLWKTTFAVSILGLDAISSYDITTVWRRRFHCSHEFPKQKFCRTSVCFSLWRSWNFQTRTQYVAIKFFSRMDWNFAWLQRKSSPLKDWIYISAFYNTYITASMVQFLPLS